jgi:hypothetical protein
MHRVENKYCSFQFNAPEITGQDKTDRYNFPACYSKGKRNIAKIWDNFVSQFNEETKFYDAVNMLKEAKMHTYCMMD